MIQKAILFLSTRQPPEGLLEGPLAERYQVLAAYPGQLPHLEGLEGRIQLLIIDGYSLQETRQAIPGLENLLTPLPSKLPRLYLLQDTDPTLSLVPLKGDQRFFYLRGPVSSRNLRQSVEQILGMKPRSVRLPVAPELGITATFTIRARHRKVVGITRPLLEISPTGFSFQWPVDEPLLFPGDPVDDLELRAQDRPFLNTRAMIRHVTPHGESPGLRGWRVGAELVEPMLALPEQPEARQGAFLDDPLVIRTVLQDAVERRTQVVVRGESLSWQAHGTMAVCDVESHRLQITLEPPGVPAEIQALDIASCQFVRDNAQLQFHSVLVTLNRGEANLWLRFPKRLDKLWARSTLRYTFPGEEPPRVTLHSPLCPRQPFTRLVENLSPAGLCFWADPDKDLLFRGMRLDALELDLPGGERIRLQGEVRYVGPRQRFEQGERLPCGVQVRSVADPDHQHLVNFLIAKNFPYVSDATPADEEALWAFLERADFYTPAKRQECLGDPVEVRDTQARMLLAPPAVSRKLVFRDKDQVFGTVSLQQVYQHTWMVHHLCAIRHPTEFVPRSLLLFLGEYISKTPEIDYIKMMWRPNNSWSNKMFGRLVHRLHDGEQSVVKRYRYLHRADQPLPPESLEERRWDVHSIRDEELVDLESHFINLEEFFLMRSEDLVSGDLGLVRLNARYRALGLYRERCVLVACRDGRLAGFSLAERSSPGLNLSNLLNTFQTHICLPDEEDRQGLREALVRHTMHYYASHGQVRAVALYEGDRLDEYRRMGFTEVKEYISWTFDHNIANIYNLYCYYIFKLYERLESQRAERRRRFQKPPPEASDAP